MSRKLLDVPHRWTGGGEELGGWILENRASLAAGGKLRLTGKLPRGLKVVFADNTAQRNLGFQLDAQDRRPLDPAFKGGQPLLILSHHNDTVQAIRAFLGRSMPIWKDTPGRRCQRSCRALPPAMTPRPSPRRR